MSRTGHPGEDSAGHSGLMGAEKLALTPGLFLLKDDTGEILPLRSGGTGLWVLPVEETVAA